MAQIPTNKKEFGFLTIPIEGEFDNVSIKKCDEFDNKLEWVINNSNKDGYYYPPMSATYELDHETLEKKRKVERSERPAGVFHLPYSHKIHIEKTAGNENPASSDEALIIHLLSFLYNTRLQFKEWRFEGRVPINKSSGILFQEKTVFHFLNHVYTWWKTQDEVIKTKFVNIIYLHCRAKSLEWEWDRFTHQYMVFDAIFNIFVSKDKKYTHVAHKKRMRSLCEHYEMVFDADVILKLSKMRNELFHEALWDGKSMGMGISSGVEINSITRLNARLICNISGYYNKFSKSGWWFYGCQSFDKYIS